ncbi:MAG: hypothetical protein JJE47_02290, partial [Acidimicrobiia bacterium]|nr:hypothetical protein [Acidimicrobiia bacterium]
MALWIVIAVGPIGLLILNARPQWFGWVVTATFAAVVAETSYLTALVGGLLRSGLGEANILIIPLAALMIFGRRATLGWFAVFVATVVWGAAVPGKGNMETWLLV